MKKFLLGLVKGAIPELVDAAVAVSMGKLREDIQKSKFGSPGRMILTREASM